MPQVGINLNEVVEKPKLPPAQPFAFGFTKCELGIAKNENKNTHQREPLIRAELYVVTPGWEHVKVYANWSLSPGALSSDDATFSVKKFFLTVGHSWNPDGTFSTEEMSLIKFVGTVTYEEGKGFAKLATVISAA